MRQARCIDPRFQRILDLGSDMHLGRDAERTLCMEHPCKVVGDVQVVCAPTLLAHTVVSEDPWTISPSILCPDCGLHGFVRSGIWVPA